MKHNNSDIFEITQRQQNQKSSMDLSDNSNFFLSSEPATLTSNKNFSVESARRLNDYDFNLLKEDAYKDVTDDVFKLEYKIAKIEEEIKSINNQIQIISDINDQVMLKELVIRRGVLEEDLEALIALYNDKSISARITEGLSNILGVKFKKKIDSLKDKFSESTEAFMLKLPGQFSALIELKKSLNKLENINKSVDELMALNLPYGENINKYDQLSKFIIKANSIQSEINHYIQNK